LQYLPKEIFSLQWTRHYDASRVYILLTEHASSAHIQIGNTTTGDSNKIILDVSKARYGCFITLRFYGTYFLLNFVLVRNVTYSYKGLGHHCHSSNFITLLCLFHIVWSCSGVCHLFDLVCTDIKNSWSWIDFIFMPLVVVLKFGTVSDFSQLLEAFVGNLQAFF